jgi:hypothetical protein
MNMEYKGEVCEIVVTEGAKFRNMFSGREAEVLKIEIIDDEVWVTYEVETGPDFVDEGIYKEIRRLPEYMFVELYP